MRTLGIDLASQPARTAGCEIEWSGGRAAVIEPLLGLADADLLDRAARCDAVGIDAPFGWPLPFVAFLTGSAHDASPPTWDDARRRELTFRRTDLHVWRTVGRVPLSVAADRIALPALRCAGLLARLGVADRAGDGRVFEVYPAAALRSWGLAAAGYKSGSDGVLPGLLRTLLDRCPWLDLTADAALACGRSDDAFDALVGALVARAAVLGRTAGPGPGDIEAARAEGWIHVPGPGSLERLADAT